MRAGIMQTSFGDHGRVEPAVRGEDPHGCAPAHVGIIMEGNGSPGRGSRVACGWNGHRRGLEALRSAIGTASDLDVSYLTVYSFSCENWTRPIQEVTDLMGLLKRFIRKDLADLHRSGVRVRIIGERERLDRRHPQRCCDEAEDLTRLNTGLQLIVAFNYGGRQEIAACGAAHRPAGADRRDRARR